MSNELHTKISTYGYALAKHKITNNDLSKMVDTNDDWITKRTGIKNRYFLEESENMLSLCLQACKQAIQKSMVDIQNIDGIIVGTSTADQAMPSMAVCIQQALGIKECVAFDVNAACAGFIMALDIANTYIRSKNFKTCLVIGADCMSRVLDFHDRSTLILFGDGAGCMIVNATSQVDEGILATSVQSLGYGFEDLHTKINNNQQTISMIGTNVYKKSIELMSQSIVDVMNKSKYSLEEVDYIIPHQANKRIILSIAHHLKVDEEKMIITIQDHGNVSAATIPIAYSIAMNQNKIHKNNLVVFTGLGAGYIYGSILLRI